MMLSQFFFFYYCLASFSPCVKWFSCTISGVPFATKQLVLAAHFTQISVLSPRRGRSRGRRGRWAVCAGARSRSAGAGAGHVVPEAVGDDPVGGVRGVVRVPEHVRLAVAAGRRVRQAEPSHLRVHAAARRVRRREPCTQQTPARITKCKERHAERRSARTARRSD
jgi:hypothetical protein